MSQRAPSGVWMGAQLIFKRSTSAGVAVVKGGNAGTNLWCTFLTLIHEAMFRTCIILLQQMMTTTIMMMMTTMMMERKMDKIRRVPIELCNEVNNLQAV